MSKKNQKRKKEMKEQQGCPRPWRQIDDTVVDAHGRIVKAPHGCSWEGDNYNDGAAAAQIIVEAVNNSQQSQPMPDTDWLRAGFLQRGTELERLEAERDDHEQARTALEEVVGQLRAENEALRDALKDLLAITETDVDEPDECSWARQALAAHDQGGDQ